MLNENVDRGNDAMHKSGWHFIVHRQLAIRNSRNDAWKVIKTRRHRILRVYGFDADAKDLLIIGDVMQELPNGKQVSGEWIARLQFTFKSESDENPKIKAHQVWAVSNLL